MKSLLILVILSTIFICAYSQPPIGLKYFGNSKRVIKECIDTCRRLLFRGDRDLNYCIEGCRIKTYKKVYDCVYDQCNDRGNGIPIKFSREKYHHCVYLCKVKPKLNLKSRSTKVSVREGKEKL